MPLYVAFLRAVNVTGRFIKMDKLAGHFSSLGFSDVETFISSGNVIFRAPSPPLPHEIASAEHQLADLLGFRSELFIRTPEEIRSIASFANTALSQRFPEGSIQVAFLAKPLDRERVVTIDRLQSESDSLVTGEKEIYWINHSTGTSRFSSARLESVLAEKVTFRRANMLARLSDQLEAILALT